MQKKITLVALVAFSCLLACCLLYHTSFQYDCKQLHPSQKEEKVIDLRSPKTAATPPIPSREEISATVKVDALEPIAEEDLLNSHETEGTENKDLTFKDKLDHFIQKKRGYDLTHALIFDSQELYKHVDINFKNTSSLEDARVILIGESHGILDDTRIQIYIIHHFGRSTDIHLIEGTAGKCERIIADINTYGWDNMKAFHESDILDTQLINLRKKLPQLKELLENQKTSWQEICDEIIEMQKKVSMSVRKRDKSLIGNIKKFLIKFPSKKLFVTAGKLHLIDERNSYNILDYLPPGEKYALVMPKEPEDDSTEFKELREATTWEYVELLANKRAGQACH